MVSKCVLFLAFVFLLVAVQLYPVWANGDKGKKEEKKIGKCIEQVAGTDKWEWNQCKDEEYDKCIVMTCDGKDLRGCAKSKSVCDLGSNNKKADKFFQKFGGSLEGTVTCTCRACNPEKDGNYCNGVAALSSQPKILASIGAMMLLGVVLKRALL